MNTERLEQFDKGAHKKFSAHFVLERDLQMLKGIISGIESDKEINNDEIAGINHWIQNRQVYGDHKVYGPIL